jgi:hypothetical protein
VSKEKEMLEKKMQRLERAKDSETSELRAKLEETSEHLRTQLKVRGPAVLAGGEGWPHTAGRGRAHAQPAGYGLSRQESRTCRQVERPPAALAPPR